MKVYFIIIAVFFLSASAWTLDAWALEIKKVKSPHGIEAWLVENHSTAIIALSAAWERPHEKKEEAGSAAMMMALLDEGAGDMNWESFRAQLENKSIHMRFNAEHDSVYGEMRTLSKNKKEAFRLFHEAITNPRFDARPVEKIRAQFLTLAVQRKQNLQSFTRLSWYRAAFGRHAYGSPVEGSAKNLRAISRDNLRRQHKKILTQKSLTIIVVGDITPEELAHNLDDIFGRLPKGQRIKKTKADIEWRARKVFLKRKSPQTVIYFGLPGLKRDDPDFVAYYVMNHIFGGGGLTSRLSREAREKRGLVYSIGSRTPTLRDAGFILGAAATRNVQADITQRLIRAVMAHFNKKGVSQKELDDAQAYLIGSYGLNFDNSLSIARNLTYIKRHRLGIDYVEKRNALIMNITRGDILRLARRLMRPEKMIIIMAGEKENLHSRNPLGAQR